MVQHRTISASQVARLALILTALSVMMEGSATATDWMMQINIRSGPDESNVLIGSQMGATDWYDDALDAPAVMIPESFHTYLYHPEWNVTIDGMKQEHFWKDIRYSLPQDFDISIEGVGESVTISWDRADIPKDGQFWLYEDGSKTWVNMSKQESYTFTPSQDPSSVTVRATWGDTCCYPLPL